MNEPKYNETAFNCPHCKAYTQQKWYQVTTKTYPANNYSGEEEHSSYEIEENYRVKGFQGLAFSDCELCKKKSIWLERKMIYPVENIIENPKELMPEDVKKLYEEARSVFPFSSRASAALLRLALEILLPQLGAEKSSLNKMILQLVSEKKAIGRVRDAMDYLRLMGNEAVHPGVIDHGSEDDEYVSLALFKILNYIVSETLESDAMVDEVYSLLPEVIQEKIKSNRESSIK